MQDYREQYIGGEWRHGSGGEYVSLNPYTAQPWATMTSAGPDDVSAAISAAEQGAEVWAATSG